MAQDQEQRQEQNSVNVLGGLNTDSSLVNQPQGTTRFVMTGVDETKEGDLGFISNEESNQQCYEIPVGYIPIGQVYIGDENNLLFLVHTSGDSALAILDKECNLTIILTDADQTEKLGFSIGNQIDATFRLRRGCERTVYWVDPKPRLFVIDKPEEFQDSVTGDWDISKFNLFKSYKSIPVVTDLEVIDGGGQLAPGSYNFSIRYLDQDFNPTEFITSTETVMIYNTSIIQSYRDIRGATKEVNQSYLNFTDSNKSIKISLDPASLDTSFPFYQIAITEANTGNGLISDTKYTQEISTRDSVFYYTGINFETQGTQEEVTIFNQLIEKATSIEQIENRLVLGDVEGKQVNFCKLQKYASQISSDLITKEVFLSSIPIDDGNSKDPAAHFNGVGYMPGEIYSFGIVYIFEDNSLSPVFHIPGKGPTVSPNTTYSPSVSGGVYGMERGIGNESNSSLDSSYIDNATCGENTFWGYDCEGLPLEDQPVRHHRFPLRNKYGLRFVQELTGEDIVNNLKSISVTVSGTDIPVPTFCAAEGDQYYSSTCIPDFVDPISFEVVYTDGQSQSYIEAVDLANFATVEGSGPNLSNVYFSYSSSPITSAALDFIAIKETVGGVENTLLFTTSLVLGMNVYTAVSTYSDLTYVIRVNESSFTTTEKQYVTDLYGIKFSNIKKPSLSDTNGQNVIGYYIVRNERTEQERTILDSAILAPSVQHKNYVSQGFLYPEFVKVNGQDDPKQGKFKRDMYGLIYPEHKFNNKIYSNFTSLLQQGDFEVIKKIKSFSKINDVADGTSYVGNRHKDNERDTDGWTLDIKTRDTHTKYNENNTITIDYTQDVNDVFYLNALADKSVKDSDGVFQNVFNLSADNKVGVISLKQSLNEESIKVPDNKIPYVYIYKENLNPYSNFRLDPYYKDSKNPHYFVSDIIPDTCEIFNGDSYINPIRYTNSLFYMNRLRKRAGQTNAWSYIAAAALVIIATGLTLLSAGVLGASLGIAASIAAGIIAAGAVGWATSLILSGIEQNAWDKAYGRLYHEGLRETVTDGFVLYDKDTVSGYERGFYKNPEDDDLQWLGECGNFWFESSVNMGLRHGSSDNTPDFLNAPGAGEPGTTLIEWEWENYGIRSVGSGTKDVLPTNTLDTHMVKKLSIFDIERKSSRSYLGIPSAEMYLLNPDYTRRNKQKSFFHLGLEYDCCTDCVESFPHRWHWSEQAFQEELTDNFRMFLPNNYKDLEGETGRITDIFRIQNALYIHTEESLWQCPQTFQERITSDVISFIGTGEYFSIPPRKIVDDRNSSAGNKHKWARTKTKFGVLFPSHKEKKWYLFDGQQLNPISDKGNYSWFLQNMNFKLLDQYYNANFKEYPFNNNPSNVIGIGYLSTYDTAKERLLITKKDFEITNLPPSDFELCSDGSTVTIFNDISQTIADRVDDGWTYVGIEDCRLKFIKPTSSIQEVEREVVVYVEPTVTTSYLESECEGVISITVPFSVEFPLLYPVVSVGLVITDCRNGINFMAQDFFVTEASNSFVATLYINGCVILGEDNANLSINPSIGVTQDGPIEIAYFEDLDCSLVEVLTNVPGYYTLSTITVEVEVFEDLVEYEDGEEFFLSSENVIDHSWTMSYSLKRQEWRSWHPYLPHFYLQVQNKFYSWKNGVNHLYKHNIEGSYQTFYDTYYPFIVEYVDNPSPLLNKVWDNVLFQSEAKKFDFLTQDYFDVKDVTFNKAILYNTHQISGLLNLTLKGDADANYLMNQTKNSLVGDTPLDRNERDWTFNGFRDLRNDYTKSMFIKETSLLQSNYYIDKIINPAAINYNKDWTQLESFRDKFLVVRLIFDTFADKKLIFNFSALDKKISER
jgi:hypothetical protein